MIDPRDITCPGCGLPFRSPGKRCWYCQREWNLGKADYDADRFEEQARARMARLRAQEQPHD